MVNRWQNEQGFLLYLDLRFPKCWRIFQKWWRAPHGPITHSSRSPSTITSQTQIYEWSLTFAPAILTRSTDDAWFNFYPFIELIPDWKFNLFVEKRVFCYRSSPRPFWDHWAHYQDINLIVADCFSIISFSFTNRPLDVDFKRFF
jgi:hypothetical protein